MAKIDRSEHNQSSDIVVLWSWRHQTRDADKKRVSARWRSNHTLGVSLLENGLTRNARMPLQCVYVRLYLVIAGNTISGATLIHVYLIADNFIWHMRMYMYTRERVRSQMYWIHTCEIIQKGGSFNWKMLENKKLNVSLYVRVLISLLWYKLIFIYHTVFSVGKCTTYSMHISQI